MHGVDEHIVGRIKFPADRVAIAECAAELVEAAEGEGELGVEVERGGREAAAGGRELGGEGELEAELGLAGAALGDELGYGVAGNAAAEAAVEDGAAQCAFLGGLGTAEEILWGN